MKRLKRFLPILLIAAIIMSAAGCEAGQPVSAAAHTANLMTGVSSRSVDSRPADAAFIESMADFSIDLFKKSVADTENSLVSPLSVMLALAMTAGGADDETLAQMEALLGRGIPLGELNRYLYSYTQSIPGGEVSKLNIANSIWFRDDGDRLRVEDEFLQRNADYYGASAFKSAFDNQTVREVNDWVKTNTDGMIDAILNDIDHMDMLFLINAIAFDAKWQDVYFEHQVRKGDFTDFTGAVQNVDFLHGSEYGYLEDDMATGFLKPYAGGRYSFAALLPDEGVSIEAYIESLTGGGFLDTLRNAQNTLVYTSMPKFEYEYDIEMNGILAALGMPDAFDTSIADFSKMGESSDGPLYIGKVLHKTFISVNESGTRAGAVTKVIIREVGAPAPQDPKIVNLDRPFVFAIIDNETNLPIFAGTLLTAR